MAYRAINILGLANFKPHMGKQTFYRTRPLPPINHSTIQPFNQSIH